MKIQVFLVVREEVRDRSGVRYFFRERRLVRQHAEDRVLAEIEAPAGTRIRRRRDQHGSEQLMVPVREGPWPSLWPRMAKIPVKYLIDSARRGAYGLSLLSYTGDPSAISRPSGPAAECSRVPAASE